MHTTLRLKRLVAAARVAARSPRSCGYCDRLFVGRGYPSGRGTACCSQDCRDWQDRLEASAGRSLATDPAAVLVEAVESAWRPDRLDGR